MDTNYFMGEIDLPNGQIKKVLIEDKNITNAHDRIERYIKNTVFKIDKYKSGNMYRPIGSFLVRHATTKEILEDSLKDFAGGWNEYSFTGFAEEIIDIVLSTIPTKALEEEIQKRIDNAKE